MRKTAIATDMTGLAYLHFNACMRSKIHKPWLDRSHFDRLRKSFASISILLIVCGMHAWCYIILAHPWKPYKYLFSFSMTYGLVAAILKL